jgi:fermentation-respiration switch protein FrsA (DUF1100 family)
VNLASGNFSWHHRPISNAGRGLSTDVDVTYNSRSSELDLGHGYDEIGEGFSLAISSLTRVNEALDVRWVDKNNDKRNDVVTLTDADGTMHRFTRHGRQVKEMVGGIEYWILDGQPLAGRDADRLASLARPDLVGAY